jgi:NADP-dependent 3-hydroxy acid dehydrogenase YdfG
MLPGPVAGAPLPEWQQMVQLNVLGLLYCAHAALPHLLRAAGDGPRQVADMINISSVVGRAARNGNGVYSLTKHGAGAFSESLRQKVARQYLRVSVVGPGATAAELASHNRPEVVESIRSQFGQRMEAGDIADAITYIVTRPHRQVALRTSAPTCPVLRSVQVHTKPGPVECAPPALHTSRSGDLVKPGSRIRSPFGRSG